MQTLKNKRVKKILLGNLIGLLFLSGAFFAFWKVNSSQAGAISNIAVSVSGTTYTVTLKPSTTIPADGRIRINFQMDSGEQTTVPTSVSRKAGTTATISALSQGANNEIVAELNSEITSGTEVTIVAGGLSNPGTGRYFATVWTEGLGTLLDGEDGNLSQYRAYYTIGTPLAIGRVLDPDGNAVSGAWVNLNDYDNTTGQPFFGYDDSDDQGYYSIGALEYDVVISSGTQVRIMANAPPESFQWGSTDATVATYAGTTINQNLQFTTPTKTIGGTVSYSNGTPIADVSINFWSSDGSGWANATTNSSGIYSVLVKGGKWDVMPQPQSDASWAYGMPPSSTSFVKDTSVESQTINFTVQRASCTLSGSVHLPDGSVPADPHRFNVSAFSMGGGGSNGQLDSNGNFSFSLPAGVYKFEAMDMDQDYASPEMDPISLSENESLDIGTVTLIARDAYITGGALDENGNGIIGLTLQAFKMKGMGWGQGRVNSSDGSFMIKVFPGEWMVNVDNFVGGESTYVMDGNPEKVKVVSGQTVTVNLNLVAANATIRGNILDSNGNTLPDTYGFVFADRAGSKPFMGPGLGGGVNQGAYTFNVPAGTYQVGIGMMPGANYSSGGPAEITISANETLVNNITVYDNDMTIAGEIRDENGNKVTGMFMEIFATNNTGGWQNAFINQSNGTYSLNVSSAVDPWSIGYFVDPSSGYFSERLEDNSISGNSGDTMTKNITVRRADATITGRVLDGDGNPMEEVMVFADNRSANQDREEPMFMGPMFMDDNITNSNGEFSLQVPNGTYYVSASLPRSLRPDLINPPRVEVALGADETLSGVELAFVKSDSVITGTVKLDGSAQKDAYVWTWSEEGGYNETQADDNGNYALNVTKNDTWHIGVNNDVIDTTDYVKSSEEIIETGNSASVTQNIAMETIEDGLAQPLSTSFTASSPKVANLSDGTKVSVPANAMATSGTVTLNASTTSEIARTTNARPIGIGLELTANESDGSDITSFNSNVTVSIPYDEDALENGMITEDDLVASYWDDNSGIWQPMDSYSIDKENNKVTFSTSHFTTFALVSDTVTGSTSEDGNSESENESDRSRPKIYRWSAERYYPQTENPKEKLKMAVWGLHFRKDATVSIGNEEANSDDVKVSPGGRKLIAKFEMKDLLKKYDPKRIIRVINPDGKNRKAAKEIDLRDIPLRIETDEINSNTSEGIMDIQNILKNLGFFNHPNATGYYGPITTRAVIEFQKAHGIDQVGVVGPITSAKLLEIKNNL